VSIWFALILLGLCALLWDAGIVLQKLAVDALPPIRLNRGLGRAVHGLLTSGKWMGGLGASAVGWGLFAYALTFTPVSVARAIQGSGFVILAVFSRLFLRHRLTPAEWLGVALITAGIAALGFAESSAGSASVHIAVPRLLAGAGVCVLVSLLVAAAPATRRSVVTVSATAGILLGLGDVATKLVLELVSGYGIGAGASAAAVSLVAFYVGGFLVLSRAYQRGRAIVATAVSDLCARLVAIVLGILGLGEALGSTPRLRALAIMGYAAVLSGALLLSRFGGEQLASAFAGHADDHDNSGGPPHRRGI